MINSNTITKYKHRLSVFFRFPSSLAQLINTAKQLILIMHAPYGDKHGAYGD
ncbi:hypothetical protein EZS27_002059 [termite gut metagenome]|uniref:Uncharacterized protein n=1 Tax=termite gut metagenome TaxID=433724 RepID=A0A5J4SWI9_9ZZZZ